MNLNCMSKSNPNIYTVEGVVISAIAVAWCEIFAALTGESSPLNRFSFYVVGIGALVNLFLCTVIDAQKVQQCYMSLVMGVTASYIWVAANVLTADSIQNSPYAQYFLGEYTLRDLFPILGISISLSLLVLQTLITAAAVTPHLWGISVTGPTVVTAVLLASKDRSCGLGFIIIFAFLAVCEVLTRSQQPFDLTKGVPMTPFIVLCISLGVQVLVGAANVYFLFNRIAIDNANLALLIIESILLGIPLLASITRCIRTAVQVYSASIKLQKTASTASLPVNPQAAAITIPQIFPQMQTAFHSTEANLFRATPLTAQWAPKKSI